MAVVFHHIGSPSKVTTSQKESITERRSHKLSDVSGGGCFLGVVELGAVEEGSDIPGFDFVSFGASAPGTFDGMMP